MENRVTSKTRDVTIFVFNIFSSYYFYCNGVVISSMMIQGETGVN